MTKILTIFLSIFFCLFTGCGGDHTGISSSRSSYDISGAVTVSEDIGLYSPVEGVTVTLDSGPTTTTNEIGRYSFTGLPNGSYKVIPNKAGYSFSPTSAEITLNGADASVNFSASPISATCDGSHLNLCTTSATCTGAGGYWYNNTCNSSLKPIERVSVDSSGTEGNDRSEGPSLSADGRYVAFGSGANNLVAGDTNNFWDVFVHDTQTGTTTRVSVDSSGTEGNDESDIPSISSDGRYVAFRSYASNLVAGDTNNAADVFVHDMQTGTTTRVSVDSSGNEGNGDSGSPSISSDGRYVAFYSLADNLVAGDTNNYYDVFVHDTQTGTTTRVSVDSSGTEGMNGESVHPSISSDGRYVAFVSRATNLVSGDTNSAADIFVHDMQTGTTTRVSVDSSGTGGNGDSNSPSISSDGRYVAFASSANNLVAGDINNTYDVFVHDMQTGTTTRVSVDSSGAEGNNISIDSSISSDGRYVAFYSFADNLVAGDTNKNYDVFVHDMQTGTTTRVSVDSSGSEGNNSSWIPVISSDGRYVAFDSFADNLVASDTNNTQDVFRAPNR